MFTGIIRHLGEVASIKGRNGLLSLTVQARELLAASPKKRGDSIAVDGTCLTVTETSDDAFTVEVMPETERHTIISSYKKGTPVNLENPLRMGDPLDGHFVQGHIDFTGEIAAVSDEGSSKILTVRIPADQKKYFALKGSVTINGVSLTISAVTGDTFSVALIPETLSCTNLAHLKPGSPVNIETDIISRYLNALTESDRIPTMIDIKKPLI